MSIRVQDVSVDINGQRIVSPTTLTVGDGKISGIVGPNGSGKTTLLRAIYRVLKPAGGTITVDEKDIWRMSATHAARIVGAVCQDHSLTYDLTVEDLVRLGRFPHKSLFDADNARDDLAVANALARVGLTPLAQRCLSELSGGEKQRAMIARGLVQEPRILVLDEPTNHLDVRFQIEVLSLLKGLGLTCVVTLHDMNLAAAYCDTLHLIVKGSVVAAGPPEEVLTTQMIRHVFGVESSVGLNPITGKPHLYFGSSLGT